MSSPPITFSDLGYVIAVTMKARAQAIGSESATT
jgi:hypothetical protein